MERTVITPANKQVQRDPLPGGARRQILLAFDGPAGLWEHRPGVAGHRIGTAARIAHFDGKHPLSRPSRDFLFRRENGA
jgi:hypothetical protein